MVFRHHYFMPICVNGVQIKMITRIRTIHIISLSFAKYVPVKPHINPFVHLNSDLHRISITHSHQGRNSSGVALFENILLHFVCGWENFHSLFTLIYPYYWEELFFPSLLLIRINFLKNKIHVKMQAKIYT